MKILIMGGTQFVSKSLATFLISKGHNVSIFTRNKLVLSYNGIQNHFIGDRRKSSDLVQLQNANFDIIFDLSAYSLEDIVHLLPSLNKTDLNKYILCSSGAVYPETINMVDENYPCGFNVNWGKYGENKLEVENYLKEYFYNTKIDISIVRPTYIYGPKNNLYREAYFFKRIEEGKSIPVPIGNAKVQFIFIDDLIFIFESLMLKEQLGVQVFNVTHPEELQWSDMINKIAKVMECSVDIRNIDYTNKMEVREFFPYRNCTYLLDTKKLRQYNVWIPDVDFEQGIRKTYEWYLKEKPQLTDLKMKKIEEALLIDGR